LSCGVTNSTIDDTITFFASCAPFGSLRMVKLLVRINLLWSFGS
jgi:hypothetical protein